MHKGSKRSSLLLEPAGEADGSQLAKRRSVSPLGDTNASSGSDETDFCLTTDNNDGSDPATPTSAGGVDGHLRALAAAVACGKPVVEAEQAAAAGSSGRSDPTSDLLLPPPDGLTFAVDAQQGPRPYMEDRADARPLPSHPGGAAVAFAVYDGHGGAAVADFCARHLLARVDAELAAAAKAAGSCAGSGSGGAAAAEPAAVAEGAPRGALMRALRAAFRGVDAELGDAGRLCGSTAACCVVTDGWLVAANAGDSRVLLVRGGRPLPLTIDHAPTRRDERVRERANGADAHGALPRLLADAPLTFPAPPIHVSLNHMPKSRSRHPTPCVATRKKNSAASRPPAAPSCGRTATA